MKARMFRVQREIRDAGASAVEYGLLVAAIAAVIVGVAFGLGGIVKNTFTQTENCLTGHVGGPSCPAPGP